MESGEVGSALSGSTGLGQAGGTKAGQHPIAPPRPDPHPIPGNLGTWVGAQLSPCYSSAWCGQEGVLVGQDLQAQPVDPHWRAPRTGDPKSNAPGCDPSPLTAQPGSWARTALCRCRKTNTPLAYPRSLG